MRTLHRVAVFLRSWLGFRKVDAEFGEELQFHLEQEVAHNRRKGMSEAEARRAATASFGGVQRFREETREARGYLALEMLARDLRRSIRRLLRSPRYSAGVVSTLAIAFAATGMIADCSL